MGDIDSQRIVLPVAVWRVFSWSIKGEVKRPGLWVEWRRTRRRS